MLSAILAILNCIPGLTTLITSLTTTYFNSKVKLTAARLGADTTVATAVVQAAAKSEEVAVTRLQVIGGSWILSALVVGFAGPWIAYEWKVIIWDTLLGWGSTNPIKGEMGTWGHIIISCLFGSGTVLTAGHMFFNRDKTGE